MLRITLNHWSIDQWNSQLKQLIGKSQKEYFGSGNLDHQNYHIRIAKYSELMRDISRQIPLLKEQLALHNKKFSKVILSRKKNKEKEVKEEKSIEIKQNKKKHQRKEKKKKVVPRNKSK